MVTIPKPNKIEVEKYLDNWDSLLAVFKPKNVINQKCEI